MRSLHVFLATSAVMVSINGSASENTRDFDSASPNLNKACKTPNFNNRPDCGGTEVGYVYNRNARLCQQITIFCPDRGGYFPTLYQCVATCNRGGLLGITFKG
ncbi:uncharacterized protein LOC142589030 [Dermacentor variabilis]|uniref:uncharacterized protein LOC142589030 n=1 Tax=Dermacentor variabilis TaxID=34621 RepID=UPI003F5C35E4